MKRKLLSVLLASVSAFSVCGALAACGGDSKTTITVWAPAAAIDGYKALVDGFKEEYPDYAGWTIRFENKEEDSVQGSLSDPKAGANIFFFPADHLSNLAFNLKCLQALPTSYAEQVEARDKEETVAYASRTKDDKKSIYAFPATDDNTYFLWYRNDKLEDSDVETLDALLSAAKAQDSHFLWNYGSSFYAISFFIGTGNSFDYVNPDNRALGYETDINNENGLKAADAYIRYLADDTYKGTISDLSADSGLGVGLKDGSLVAGIGGTWVLKSVKTAMGDNFDKISTAPLPSFQTSDVAVGNTYKMGSFNGGKFCGVNSAKDPDQIVASLAFANYLTSKKGQEARYNATNSGPTNKEVYEQVKDDPILQTVKAQRESCVYEQQDQPSAFWNGINAFANQIVQGATTASNVESKLNELAESLNSL